MNIVLLILILLFASEMRFAERDKFFDDYCSVRKTNAIKGIVAIGIFLSHSMDYLYLGENDLWVRYFSEYLRQLIVVPFLFYSGFGIMESIQKKGLPYVLGFPVTRILKTILYADVAVVAFALLFLVKGWPISLKQFLLSLVFWDQIENNTWYFFVIVFLYFFTYVGFRISHRNYYLAAALTTVLSIPLFYFLIETKDIFWYNTFFLYHFGMWYSLIRRYIERIVMHNDFTYCVAMLLAFMAYSFFRNFGSFYYFIICGCFLMTLIVGITMKVSIDNPLLQYLGRNVQGIYIFHRLPLRLTLEMNMSIVSKFIFSVLVTAVLCFAFEIITKWIDRVILSRFDRKRLNADLI